MWDGSAVPVAENLQIAEELLALTTANKQILEIEVGVVGGEEDGVSHEINEKLYSTVEDGMATAEALGLGEKGRYITALTFGNVHGVYKPGFVKLRPEVLKEIQDAVGAKYGVEKPFDLVFHGGSEARAGDRGRGELRRHQDERRHRHQYAFTRPVADWMFRNYDGVPKVDGEVGNKKQYDPRAWARWPRLPWLPASSRPARTWARSGPPWSDPCAYALAPVRGGGVLLPGRLRKPAGRGRPAARPPGRGWASVRSVRSIRCRSRGSGKRARPRTYGRSRGFRRRPHTGTRPDRALP